MNILYVNACVRDKSRTNELAQYFINKLNTKIDEINLNKENILPLSKEHLELREFFIKNNDYSHQIFDYAKQFANADIILIAAPYWDLSFPAILKTYIEHINVSGITFCYSEKGYPKSLCKAKKLIYITTAGGIIVSNDYGFGYIKSLAENFYNIKNINYIKAEGLDIYDSNVQKILEKSKKEIDVIYKTFI